MSLDVSILVKLRPEFGAVGPKILLDHLSARALIPRETAIDLAPPAFAELGSFSPRSLETNDASAFARAFVSTECQPHPFKINREEGQGIVAEISHWGFASAKLMVKWWRYMCDIRESTEILGEEVRQPEVYSQRLLSDFQQWEDVFRSLFCEFCEVEAAPGVALVEHAALVYGGDWLGPEGCSMIFHANPREFIYDVVRCFLSLARATSMLELFDLSHLGENAWTREVVFRLEPSGYYLDFVDFGSRSRIRHFIEMAGNPVLQQSLLSYQNGAGALVELAAESCDAEQAQLRNARKLRQSGDQCSFVQRLGHLASIRTSRFSHGGLALMSNPFGRLLGPFCKVMELSSHLPGEGST